MPVAVDSSFLLLLGDGESDSREANRLLQNDGYDVFCTNTALVEMGKTALDEKDLAIRKMAQSALEGLRSKWNIRPAVLSGVNNAIADNIARELQKLFPDLSYHGALVIGEAAVEDSFSLLVTWDPELLDLERGQLALFLNDRCQKPIAIISPAQVIPVLRKKLERRNVED